MSGLMRRLLLTVAGVCLWGCLSPTLPLPPPTQPQVSTPGADGTVRLQGVAAPDAEVYAYNRDNGLIAGQVTSGDARYDFRIQAEVDDTIELWYQQGTDESQSVVFTVPGE